MDRKAVSVLFLALAILAPASLSGQEASPLLVEGPRISRTAFTNWESIELTYTVRWLDGYEPLLDDLRPQAMSFGVLELDPDFAEKSDIRNERKFENENFFDIVYHLRYMADKKGEIVIPGPRFPYKRAQSGDTQVQHFATPEFPLVYNTVLPKDASDIKEEFDLGSYQTTAMYWTASAVATVLIGILGSFALVFFRPVPAPLATNVAGEASTTRAIDKEVGPAQVISELESNIAEGNIGAVCNGLADVIRAYAPGINPGMTSKEMTASVLSISNEWEKNQLLRIHAALCDIEDHLFVGGDDVSKVEYHMSHLGATVRELRPWSVYWHRRLFNLKQKLVKPFSSLNRLIHWRRS